MIKSPKRRNGENIWSQIKSWYHRYLLHIPERNYRDKNERCLEKALLLKRSTNSVTIDGVRYRIMSETNNASASAEFKSNPLKEIIIRDVVKYKGKIYNVTEIGPAGFLKCENLCRVYIPSSIQVIRRGAFLGCTNLREISIDGMSDIDFKDGVFADCNFNKLQIIHRNQ